MSADLADPSSYARFLRIQLAARAPIESWLGTMAPSPLVPPALAPLLIDDLSALGYPCSYSLRPFAIPAGADPVGAAWALAGSHLGNRAMLAGLGQRAAAIPSAFLSDQSMMQFWRGLLPRLNQPAGERSAAAAVVAANAVFDHFLAIAAAEQARFAA